MDALFEIKLDIAGRGTRASGRTLYEELKAAITDGRLRPGTQLPATRASADYFAVSRNTAVQAYHRLLNEGLLVSRQGSGTFVADAPPISRGKRPATVPATSHPALNPFWLREDVTSAMGFWRDTPDTTAASAPSLDFRPALIDPRLFPFDIFRRVMSGQLRGLEKRPARYKSPQGNQGNYQLREAITRHIALMRAVVCGADDILVTSGAQQAFDLLARVLVTPGQTVVAVEDPGYPPMRVAFAAAGATLVPVPVDDEGLMVDRLPTNAGVICLCPSHQFPLGVSMSPRRRQALLDFARQHGAVIVEDDYDGEFRHEGSPLEVLRKPEHADTVFYVGTFSKCMLPSLRLGYLVAPAWAMPTLVAAKNCMDWHCPTPIQLGVARFIDEGHLAAHVRRMRQRYRERREALVSMLAGLVPKLTPLPSAYGMHMSATVAEDIDAEAVAELLQRQRIRLHTLSRYYHGSVDRHGFVFGFGAAEPEQILGVGEALAEALSASRHR
ncbi:PLP-dependent aminotransferase family protein [Pinirhizobacter soli]|uniref:MocR-like pyridoxine biosynthesis transcription factor PdxR n=1 Tax=Pinirhizobacter soli TaxID=2786953 RepID=UPI002029C969|nr:PLP-dependent aminotransferase family protein [Pinirhizobacter soli]